MKLSELVSGVCKILITFTKRARWAVSRSSWVIIARSGATSEPHHGFVSEQGNPFRIDLIAGPPGGFATGQANALLDVSRLPCTYLA